MRGHLDKYLYEEGDVTFRFPVAEADDYPALSNAETAAFSPEFQRRMKRAHAIGATRMAEANIFGLSESQLKTLKADLEAARLATNDRIVAATKDWDVGMQKAVLSELDGQLKRVEAQQSVGFRDLMSEAWERGAGVIPDILARTKMSTSALPSIDARTLNASVLTAPELITNITDEVRKGVSSLLRQGALGQMNPLDLMKRIGTTTGKGPWRNAFTRGEVIYRTETGRLFQTANYSRLAQMAERDPEWGKEWVSSEDVRVRPTHVRANGQKRKADELFDVGDSKALYPHDPQLPAKESVNCRCLVAPWHPDWEKKEPDDEFSDFDPEKDPERQQLDAALNRAQAEADSLGQAYRAAEDRYSKLWGDAGRGLATKEQVMAALTERNRLNSAAFTARQNTAQLRRSLEERERAYARAQATRLTGGLSPQGIIDLHARLLAAQRRANLTPGRKAALGALAGQVKQRAPLTYRVEGTRPTLGTTRAGGKPRKLAETGQRVWDEFLAISAGLEQQFGLRSRWVGTVNRGTTRTAVASFGWDGVVSIASKQFDNLLDLIADYQRDPASWGGRKWADMRRTLLHEALHGVSPGLTAGNYGNTGYGWEEGVAEMNAQILSAKMFPGQRPSYVSYRGYGSWLEALRKKLGMGLDFYERLLTVPFDQRPAMVARWVSAKFPTPGPERTEAESLLRSADRVMHISHRQQDRVLNPQNGPPGVGPEWDALWE